MNASRGIKIARLASGMAIRNSPVRPTAAHTPSSPARTATIDVAIRYAVSSSEHITSPWLMCAPATCDQANAASASHASRRDHRSACRYPLAPTSAIVVQARNPANGMLMAMSDVDISIPRQRPPTVAIGRDMASFRRNQNSPSPASSGLNTISARIAAPGESDENSTIGGTYSQPLCGSAANR